MLSWIAVEMRTGRKICELPTFSCKTIGAKLCDYTSVQDASLPLDGAPMEWKRALTPYATVLVAIDGDNPVWGGIVTSAPRTEADEIAVSLATWESYLGRVSVPDLDYVGQGQCEILADVIDKSLDDTVPLQMRVHPSVVTRDLSWSASEDKKVLTVFKEVSDLDDGPEWTITWKHYSSPERYVPILEIADHIGVSPAEGLAPAATFEYPGCIQEFSYEDDWADGGGANRVIATSSAGSGDSRPESAPQIFADPDRPTIEYRFAVGNGLDDDLLDSYAAKALNVLYDGSSSLSFSAVVDSAPKLGSVWNLGDDIGYLIRSRSVGEISGMDRCLAWSMSLEGVQMVTPTLPGESVSTS